jgi:hypothetical protein
MRIVPLGACLPMSGPRTTGALAALCTPFNPNLARLRAPRLADGMPAKPRNARKDIPWIRPQLSVATNCRVRTGVA